MVFAIHPRTRKRLDDFGLLASHHRRSRIRVTEPLSYIDFMNLVTRCAIAITDSGGVQEETTYLGIPCARCAKTPNGRSRSRRAAIGCCNRRSW